MIMEIKFRGISMQSNSFVYGNYIESYVGECRIIWQEPFGEMPFSDLKDNDHIIEPSTLGQFVGLSDKNGNEAYVGNIYKETLLDGTERYYKIWVEKGGFVINQFQDDFHKPTHKIQFWQGLSDMQTASWFESNLEEVGNIHQNPELL